jgi:hypothetical protein
MTQKETQLDAELIWEPDGHLTETAITALADGELDIVPGAAEHADGCEVCHDKVGSAALLALEIASALELVPRDLLGGVSSPLPAAVSARRKPFPVTALTLAVSVAFLALSPNLGKFAVHVESVPLSLTKVLPVLAQLIARLGTSANWLGRQYLVHFAAAFVLCACGALIARRSPHKFDQQGAA